MFRLRNRNRLVVTALAVSLLPCVMAAAAFAGEVCMSVFAPPASSKQVCFDCNSVALSLEQERVCDLRCGEAKYKYKSMCYRRRANTNTPPAARRTRPARTGTAGAEEGIESDEAGR